MARFAFLLTLLLWNFASADNSQISVRDDNKFLWIDLVSFAKENQWDVQWNTLNRSINVQGKVDSSSIKNNNSLTWFIGVPWVKTPKGVVKLESAPRFDDSVLWVPLHVALSQSKQFLSSNWIWNAQNRLVKTAQSSSSQNQSSSSNLISTNTSKTIKTIVIDPGHGGKDPGAIGEFAKEKDVVLAVGLKLRQKLEKKGFVVKMTRENDTFVDLQDRPAMASKWNGDLFISLHCDAIDGEERRKKAEGFKIYILREAQSEEDKAIARRENKAAELSSHKRKAEITPLEWIVLENQLNAYTKDSERFAAKLVQNYEVGQIRKTGSGAGQAGFMVLVGAFMPAVLVELGFISHPEDGKYLASAKGQEEIAERIAKAIISFSLQ